MENFFRKYGWTIRLGAIAVVCLLIALSVNGFISSVLAPYTVPEVPDLYEQAKQSSAKSTTAKTTRNQNWTKNISERCFFGCTETPENTDAPQCPEEGCPEGQQCVGGQCVEAGPTNPTFGNGSLPVASDLNLKLKGVMVSNQPEWSTAILEDESTKQTYFVRTGEQIVAQATLTDVRRDRIIFERNGRLEYIRLVDSIAGNPSLASLSTTLPPNLPTTTLPSSAQQIDKDALEKSMEQQNQASGKTIQRVDNNTYAVDRKSMNEKLQDRQALAQGATVVPNYKNGKKSGLKLVNVQSNSIYGQLGMSSGDVLMSVNGSDIRSQAHAMELMERFKEADSVVIAVERKGKTEKIKYNIK